MVMVTDFFEEIFVERNWPQKRPAAHLNETGTGKTNIYYFFFMLDHHLSALFEYCLFSSGRRTSWKWGGIGVVMYIVETEIAKAMQ
jgi:hypothetical protein